MQAPVFAPYALYLLPEEKLFWEHIKTGVPFRRLNQSEAALKVINALLSANLLVRPHDSGVLSSAEKLAESLDSLPYTLIPCEGIIVFEISDRRTYTLKPHRYDLVRAIQKQFKPIKGELRGDSRDRLDIFIEEWKEKNNIESDDLAAGSWLMSSARRDTPSQGSALVTLVKEVGHLFLTIEGLEGFNLERSEKTEGRVVSPRTTPNDVMRESIPSSPSTEPDEPDEHVRIAIRTYETEIEQLNQRNRNDQGTIADHEKLIAEIKQRIADRESAIQVRERKIKALTSALDPE